MKKVDVFGMKVRSYVSCESLPGPTVQPTPKAATLGCQAPSKVLCAAKFFQLSAGWGAFTPYNSPSLGDGWGIT